MLHISTKDLNLLPVFEALLAERHVSRAAKRLSLSQPALSHALARLREAFGDELFVRVARGMTPTPRALELAPRVTAALAAVRAVYAAPAAFDPARAEGRIRLASTEFFEHLLLPKLLPRLRRDAPGVVLVSRSTAGKLPKEELEAGGCDLAVAGFFGTLPEGFYRQPLFDDGFACVVRQGHPTVSGPMTLRQYLELDHLLISPQGDLDGVVDRALAEKGRQRRVVAGIGNFLTPASVVAASDLILTLPARLAALYAKEQPLQVLPLPISLKVPGITLVQVWHERTNADPLHRWFRKLLVETL